MKCPDCGRNTDTALTRPDGLVRKHTVRLDDTSRVNCSGVGKRPVS